MNFQKVAEEIHVMGTQVVEKVKELIHEGNVQRIIIKNEQGHTLVEIPVTLAAIGVIAAPVLAAVSAIAGILDPIVRIVLKREMPSPWGNAKSQISRLGWCLTHIRTASSAEIAV